MKRAHSRYFLPVEMFLAIASIALAYCGSIGQGPLRAALQVLGSEYSWPVIFAVIGAARLFVTVLEWVQLRGAPVQVIFQVSSARSILAAACFMSWLSAILLILLHGLAPYMTFLVLVGLAVLGFNAWSFYENMKVRYATNPHVPTPNLQYRDRRV